MLTADIEAYKNSISNKDRASLVDIAVENYRQIGELSVRIKSYQDSETQIFIQFQETKKKLEKSEKEPGVLRKQLVHLKDVRTSQAQEMYGCSSEKLGELLNEAAKEDEYKDPLDEDAPDSDDTPDEGADVDNKNDENKEKRTIIKFPDRTDRSGNGGRKGKTPKNESCLPKCEIYDCDVDALNKEYGEGNWRFAFWEAHESIEIQRQYAYRKIVYTPKISVGLEHRLESKPYEGRILPKSKASSSLLSVLTCDLYDLHLPLYRQENNADRFGIDISRQKMSNWILKACRDYMQPIRDYMYETLKHCSYQQCDETYYNVIKGMKNKKGYVWIHRTSEHADVPPVILYCFETTRSSEHLFRFFDGVAEPIYLTSDAYSAYYSLKKAFPNLFFVCGCFMHARRRLVDSLRCIGKKLTDDELQQLPEMCAIKIISEIYEEEGKLAGMKPSERHKIRLKTVKPLIDRYFELIRSIDTTDPQYSDKFKDAVWYSINQEKALRNFLKDGNIPIDNGATERNVKCVAAHRKNSMFSYSIKGAVATSTIFTLIETAKANDAIPYYYIKYVLEQMSGNILYNRPVNMEDMMPWSLKYKEYESEQQRQLLLSYSPPPGNERPKTPRKNKCLRIVA